MTVVQQRVVILEFSQKMSSHPSIPPFQMSHYPISRTTVPWRKTNCRTRPENVQDKIRASYIVRNQGNKERKEIRKEKKMEEKKGGKEEPMKDGKKG